MAVSMKALLAASGMILVASQAEAQEFSILGGPTVAYKGERTITTSDVSMVQTVHAKPGKGRYETVMEGMRIVQIWRDDLNLLWSLTPGQNLAISIPYGSEQANSPFAALDDQSVTIEKRLIGTETVNGVQASRYYVTSSGNDGGGATGHVWMTPQNITVRMRMQYSEPGESPGELHFDLTGLVIADQPDSLFELPHGYQVMSMGAATPSVAGMMGVYAGDVARDATDEAAAEADRTVRGTARNEARKAVRKILKW